MGLFNLVDVGLCWWWVWDVGLCRYLWLCFIFYFLFFFLGGVGGCGFVPVVAIGVVAAVVVGGHCCSSGACVIVDVVDNDDDRD